KTCSVAIVANRNSIIPRKRVLDANDARPTCTDICSELSPNCSIAREPSLSPATTSDASAVIATLMGSVSTMARLFYFFGLVALDDFMNQKQSLHQVRIL